MFKIYYILRSAPGLAALLLVCIPGCRPSIKSFTAVIHDTTASRTITGNDTLRINWAVRGKPALLVHETASADSGVRNLDMTLVAQKGNNEVSRNISIKIVPQNSSTKITISTKRNGDTLVAADIKNPGRWGDRFEIESAASASGRTLFVWHAGITATLDSAGAFSKAFEGTPLEGRWELRSPMTAEEIKDNAKAPETLQINTIIRYKRR